MVHVIPLSVGQRRPGNIARYPASSPAAPQLDGHWQAVAERHEQRMAQQRAFDTEIVARRLNDEIARAEADAVANAPADGAGLHDAMYGQVDPRTGQVVKTGLFDTLVPDFLKQVPADLRPGLASRKAALREAGSLRMAIQQLQRRKQYEQNRWSEIQTSELGKIANGDPDDGAAFDAARQAGLDLLAKMDIDPEARRLAETAWRASAAKARMEALIARDPRRAVEMLSPRPATGDGVSEIAEPRANASRQGRQAAAENQPTGRLTPDETVAEPFGDDISPEQRPALLQQARMADTAKQVETRVEIGRAEQDAPASLRKTGTYSGPMPTEEQFAALFGVSEGGKRFQAFSRALEISRQFHNMLTMPNEAIRAMVASSKPDAGSVTSEQDRSRREAIVAAADLTFKARQDDPGGYVRDAFKDLDAAWKNLAKPEDYQAAVAGSIAAQQQLGFERVQPLPNAAEGSVLDGPTGATQPRDPGQELGYTFAALDTPAYRQAMLAHLLQPGAAQPNKSTTDRTSSDAIVDPMMLLDLPRAAELGVPYADVEARNYVPTLQDKIGGLIAGNGERGSMRRFLAQKLIGSEGAGEQGFSAADLTPAGTLFAADKAITSIVYGNYGDALLNAAAVVPAERVASVGLKQVDKVVRPLVDELQQVLKRPDGLVEGADALLRGGRGKLPGSAEEAASEAVDRSGEDLSRLGSEAIAEGASGGANRQPTGQVYSVVFQMILDPSLYPGGSRPRHFQAANEALLVVMERNPDFATALREAGIILERTKRGLAPRTAPPGYTWHHALDTGVMQLVPRYQHDPGSIFQKALHPNRKGGFYFWGKQ